MLTEEFCNDRSMKVHEKTNSPFFFLQKEWSLKNDAQVGTSRHFIFQSAFSSVQIGGWWASSRKPHLNKEAEPKPALCRVKLLIDISLVGLNHSTWTGTMAKRALQNKRVNYLFRCSYIRLYHVSQMWSAQRNACPCHGHSLCHLFHSSLMYQVHSQQGLSQVSRPLPVLQSFPK